MGNGRVFYSGINAKLEALNESGVPEKLVRGFACPSMASIAKTNSTALLQVIKEFDAVNPTNFTLARILTAGEETPAYVAQSGEEDRLDKAFDQESNLLDNTTAILKEALELHKGYRNDDIPAASVSDVLSISKDRDNPYAQRISTALKCVLTPSLQVAIGKVSPAEIATTILAFEAGKLLSYSLEGGRWTRRSNFPHLSARAVLHSLAEFPADYDADSRTMIRRALVYAARKSPFAPIRLPLDLDLFTQALRQWSEVLLACPHELPEIAVELSLVAQIRESASKWQERFFNRSSDLFLKLKEESYATRTDLLFVPLRTLNRSLSDVVNTDSVGEMKSLLLALEATQRLSETFSKDGDNALSPILSFERIDPWPNQDRITEFSRLHGITPQEMNSWITLRYVLSSFGWIASRVGDYSVPDIGAVFAVFQGDQPLNGANQHGRMGRAGMVPLRAARVREILGSDWSLEFMSVGRVTIAESERDFEKLLRGVDDRNVVDNQTGEDINGA